jgi:hypothetical protein
MRGSTKSLDNATAIRATNLALLCEIAAPAGVFTAWVPSSQIDAESEVRNVGDRGRLIVSVWWYKASKTSQQFPSRPESQASHGRKSHEPPTKLEDIGGFKKGDFDFTAEDRRQEPEANTKVEIDDNDVPF